MDSESTTKSVSIDTSQHQMEGLAKHLINTTKVLRGHKLKTQDFIRLQLMRFRYCSPVKYEDQIQQNLIDLSKTTEFTDKYRGFECEDDDKELHKMITYQREKHSREVAKRIKLLNPYKNQPNLKQQKMTFYNTHFSIKVKPATSQERRTTNNWKKLNKTISFNQTDNGPSHTQLNKIQFTSKNLGEKMNHYMNQMIDPSAVTLNAPEQTDNKEPASQCKDPILNRFEKNIPREKKQQNTYLKQMKKRFKSKYSAIVQTSKLIPPIQNISQQNVANFRHSDENSMKKLLQASEQPIFYSMQLKSDIKESPEYKGKYHPQKSQVRKMEQYNEMKNYGKISK